MKIRASNETAKKADTHARTEPAEEVEEKEEEEKEEEKRGSKNREGRKREGRPFAIAAGGLMMMTLAVEP